jgi:hypothetical protein
MAEHVTDVRAPVTASSANDGDLVYRRVQIGNALGRIEDASKIPGRWSFGRWLPDRWRCHVRMDNGMAVHAWLDEIRVVWDE